MKRCGFLWALLALPALAQVSGDPGAQAAAERAIKLFRQQHGPVRNLVIHEDGSVASENWSGYAVTGSDFTSAEASWTEPSVSCGSGTELGAFWVGLDGYSSKTVEQIGTLIECAGGRASHSAWYEFYPKEKIQPISGMTVSAGDRFSASVTYSGSTFTLKITNETTGKSFTTSEASAGQKRSSAEWIAEAPCCLGRDVYPLPDFHTVSFGQDYTGITGTNDAADSSQSGAFNSFPKSDVFGITMETSGKRQEAVPSAPSADGTSFKVTWKAE